MHEQAFVLFYQDGSSVHEVTAHAYSCGDGPVLLPATSHASFSAELRLLHDLGGTSVYGALT